MQNNYLSYGKGLSLFLRLQLGECCCIELHYIEMCVDILCVKLNAIQYMTHYSLKNYHRVEVVLKTVHTDC